jgi:tRNA pseudouridine38/39 synthase
MESTDEDAIAKANEHKSVKLKKQQCDYANMTNHDLIQEIKRLNSHVTQLKALFEKSQNQNDGGNLNKPVPNERTFDFNRFNKRHVLLKFAYLGWDYKVIV